MNGALPERTCTYLSVRLTRKGGTYVTVSLKPQREGKQP